MSTNLEKFSSQMNSAILAELRSFSKESKRNMSEILSEAIQEYLERVKVRPAFRKASQVVLDDHADLLERLAK